MPSDYAYRYSAGDTIAGRYADEGKTMSITTSHPAMIHGLARAANWRTSAVKKTGHGVQRGARTGALTGYVTSVSQGRAVVSFRYVGPGGCPNFREEKMGLTPSALGTHPTWGLSQFSQKNGTVPLRTRSATEPMSSRAAANDFESR